MKKRFTLVVKIFYTIVLTLTTQSNLSKEPGNPAKKCFKGLIIPARVKLGLF